MVIHNTAGDSYELFPTCHSLCSAASVCPSNCSPVDFTLAPTARFLADLPGCFLLAIIWGHFAKRKSVNIQEGIPKQILFAQEARCGYPIKEKAFHLLLLIYINIFLSNVLENRIKQQSDFPNLFLPKIVQDQDWPLHRLLSLCPFRSREIHQSVFKWCGTVRRFGIFHVCLFNTPAIKPAGPQFAFERLISKRKHFHTKQQEAK